MLLISMYVRRILTVSRESAAQTTSSRNSSNPSITRAMVGVGR